MQCFGERLHRLLIEKGVLLAIVGAYLATFRIHDCAPLACAAFLCAWLRLGNYPLVFLLSLLGSALSANTAASVSLLALMGICIILTLWRTAENITKGNKLAAFAAAQVITVGLCSMTSAYDCLVSLLLAGIAFVTAVVFCGGASAAATVYRKKRLLTQEEQIMLCITTGILIAGLTGLGGLVSLAIVASSVACMIAAHSGGVTGICFAVSACIAPVLCGDADFAYAGTAAFSTLICSAFVQRNKWGTALCFTVSMAIMGTYITDSVSMLQTVSAAMAFVLIPQRALNRYSAYSSPISASSQAQQQRSNAQLKTARAALCTISDVSRMLIPFAESQAGNGFLTRQLNAISSAATKNGKRSKTCDPDAFSVDADVYAIPKQEGESVGDCSGYIEINSKLLLVLSDGMGSGDEARAESKSTIQALTDLISAGFDTLEALECTNKMMLLKGKTEMYATLDALLFDKVSGEGQFIKFGAPPSFLVREGQVHTICGESLPIGIVDNAEPSVHSLRLKEDDIVILMTDGVTDSLGSSLVSTIIDAVSRSSNDSNKLASTLIDAGRSGGVVDDMSVLAVVIGKKH